MGARAAIAIAVAAIAAIGAAYGVVLPRVDGASAQEASSCRDSVSGGARIDRTRVMVLCLLNEERARHGLRPLERNAILEAASQRHSEDMARRHYFEHESPDRMSPEERIRAAGFTEVGIGVVYDAPFWVGKRQAAIYTTDFGGPLEPTGSIS